MNNDINQVNSNNTNVGVYKATGNLNTAMENPNIDVDSATGVNIQNNQVSNNSFDNSYSFDAISNSSYVSNSSNVNGFDTNNNINNFDASNNNVNMINNSSDSTMENTEVSYEPVYEKKEVSDEVNYEPVYEKTEAGEEKFNPFKSRELKMIIFIGFLLLIFILLLPYIFDFFQKISLMIANSG